jgi:hypothetical protein
LIATRHHALLLLENDRVTKADAGKMRMTPIERLLAEADCARLLHAYGRAVDWQDAEGLAGLFWPDAAIDLGFFKGNGAEATAFLLANAARSQRRFHATSNILLRIEGDTAFADSCCVTHAVGDDAAGGLGWQLFYGRYLDRLERRGAEWRFAERAFLLNAHHAGPCEESPLLAAVPRADGFAPDHPMFRFR